MSSQCGSNRNVVFSCKFHIVWYPKYHFAFLKRRLPTLWTHSYFVATVGGAPRAIVKQYIENQKHV